MAHPADFWAKVTHSWKIFLQVSQTSRKTNWKASCPWSSSLEPITLAYDFSSGPPFGSWVKETRPHQLQTTQLMLQEAAPSGDGWKWTSTNFAFLFFMLNVCPTTVCLMGVVGRKTTSLKMWHFPSFGSKCLCMCFLSFLTLKKN